MIPVFYTTGEEAFLQNQFVGQGSACQGATGFNQCEKIIGVTGKITDMLVRLPTDPDTGGTKSWVFQIVVNGVPVGNTAECFITGSLNICQGTTGVGSASGGWVDVPLNLITDRVTIIITTPTPITPPTAGTVAATLLFSPT